MGELVLALVDAASFDGIPDPAAPGAGCRTCDYWERLDGHREKPADDAPQRASAALKRRRILAAEAYAGSYGMLAYDEGGVAVGYAQFGPLSAYPRAQVIRDRYPELPESPAPWVITCLQLSPSLGDRDEAARHLLEGVCDELDRRGIMAVEAYPDGANDAWLRPPGPPAVYASAGFERAAGDDRFPVFRRELAGETAADAWSGLLRAAEPDDGDEWPLPLPTLRDEDEVFRLPEKPRRPNPFGED